MIDFLIIGTPKAGTTALQYYLKQHEEVFMPEIKELHFFGDEFRRQTIPNNEPYQYNLGIKEYENHFTNAKPNQIKGEASVFYLYSKSAIEQIKAYNPNMKIVV